MLSDRLRQISVRPAPKLSVRATVKSNLLDVELGASGFRRQTLPSTSTPTSVTRRLRAFVRRHHSFGRGCPSRVWPCRGSGVDAVDLLDGVSLPASSTLFVDSMLARTPALEADRDAAFRRTVERLDTLGKMDFTVPASLKATMRGYQVDGYQWLGSLEHLGLGGILAETWAWAKRCR